MTEQNGDTENNKEGIEEEVLDASTDAVDETEAEEIPATNDELVAAAQQEAAEARQDMLRVKADMDNVRKRLIREQEKARKRTLERFMNDLLPVRDSLERGLEAAADPSATVESLKEGKQLIMKMLGKAMADHGLVTIDPMGEAFNPEKHEAMTMLPSADHDENTVIDVLEKGYQLHERLIRPAKVVVSRKP